MILICTSRQDKDIEEARTEIPRFFSTSRVCERLVPLSTFPAERMLPLR